MYKIITDLLQLDEFWREGVLYVCPKDSDAEEYAWVVDNSEESVSEYLEGWHLQENGSWSMPGNEGTCTWAIRLED